MEAPGMAETVCADWCRSRLGAKGPGNHRVGRASVARSATGSLWRQAGYPSPGRVMGEWRGPEGGRRYGP